MPNIWYRPARAKKLNPKAAPLIKPKTTAEVGYIKGQKAGSSLEWNVSQALDILDLRYLYQYVIGMRGVLGSQTLDFLVFTPGQVTPLNVHGRYWHTGVHADELDDMNIIKLMGGNCRKPVIIWEENCQTVNDAVAFLRQHLAIG